MSEAEAPAAEWYPDPSGKFQFRYWDGEQWTGHVSTDGKTDWDPPGGAAEDAGAATDEQASAAESSAQGDVDLSATQTVSPEAQQAALAAASAASAAAGDDAWAPAEATPSAADTGDAGQAVAAEPGPAATPQQESPAEQSAVGGEAEVEPTPQPEPAAAAAGGTIEPDEPADTNLVANRRAGLDDDVQQWLDAVAAQVDPRLSRIEGAWASRSEAEAARACAYGLLVGHLGRLHPHMRPELSQVAEAHPSFTTLPSGSRLETLEQIAGDPARATAWLGPLIGTDDVERVKMLFD